MTDTLKDINPEFIAAVREYERIARSLGEESTEAMRQFALMMRLAPDWLKEFARKRAVELALIPENSSGFLKNGTPVYSLGNVAATLGISEEEVRIKSDQLFADMPNGKIDGPAVHARQ